MVLILQVVGASSLGQGASVRFGTWVLVEDAVPDVYVGDLWIVSGCCCRDVFVCVRFGAWAVAACQTFAAVGALRPGHWCRCRVPLQGAAARCLRMAARTLEPGRSRRCRVQRAPLTDVHGHVHFGAWVLAPLQSATACLLVVRGL